MIEANCACHFNKASSLSRQIIYFPFVLIDLPKFICALYIWIKWNAKKKETQFQPWIDYFILSQFISLNILFISSTCIRSISLFQFFFSFALSFSFFVFFTLFSYFSFESFDLNWCKAILWQIISKCSQIDNIKNMKRDRMKEKKEKKSKSNVENYWISVIKFIEIRYERATNQL